MAKKGNRVQVILECTEHKGTGKPGTSRYITTKNKKNSPDRMEIKKLINPLEATALCVIIFCLSRFKSTACLIHLSNFSLHE